MQCTATPRPTASPLPGPVVVPSPTPTATPTATPAGSSSGPPQAPVAPGGNGKAGGGSGPVIVNGTEHITTAPSAAPRRPLGNLPLFGAAAAGFLAAWGAYARRKRLQRAWEEERERAARAAREAARRAKAAALIAAVARDLARRRQRQAAASADDPPPEDEPPPRPHRIPLTIDGEVPLEEAAEGRVPQPGPPRPDGSFNPHRGRGLWGNEHGPVTPTLADEAFDAEVSDEKSLSNSVSSNASEDNGGNEGGNNPPLWILIIGGLVLSGVAFGSEILLIPGEAVPPPVDIGAAGLGVFLPDMEVAYWAYVYRVAVHPEKKQKIILFPPWGLNK